MPRSFLDTVVRKSGLPREKIAAVRMYVEREALARRRRPSPRPGGRILCYHSVGQPVMGVNDVSPALFRRQIMIALESGYRFVAPAQLAETGGGPMDLAITFDDGLSSLKDNAEPILSEFNIPWTVFAVTDWCERQHPYGPGMVMSWDDLAWISERGAEIGNHSASHPNFSELSEAQAEDELVGSQAVFAKRLGYAPPSFAIPFGQSGNWSETSMRAAQRVGFKTIYAQAEATRPPDTVARTFVTRFDTKGRFLALLGGAYDQWEEWV